MTCTHISKVSDKINNFIGKINNSDPSVCKKDYLPADKLSSLKNKSGQEWKNALDYLRLTEGLDVKVINIDGFNDSLKEMFNELRDCNCDNEAISRTTDRLEGVYAKNSVSKDEYDRLFKRHEKDVEDYNNLSRNTVSKEDFKKLETEYKQNIKDYNELIGEHKELAEKCRNLVRRLEEYEEYKEKFEETRDGRERERVDNAQEITALRRDNVALQGQLTRTQQRLTTSENKVARIEDRLETRNREVIELKNKLERLSVDVDNLEKSREELFNEKVNLKNDKLEIFANNSGINLDEVNNLLRYYERLVHARKNYNQANIETHEGNINRVKGILRQNGVGIGDTQKCCRKCEKVAKLRIELNEIRQQQFEARQEVPPHQ